MNIVKFSTAVILAGLIFSACTVSPSYDNYTWDGTAYTDADSDGIPDVAEKEGTSFYDMPLYDWGARPGTPDLFIHIAPMVAGADPDYPTYPDGGMLLQKKALDRVVAAFAAQGIALHFDVGKRRLYDGYTEITGRDKTSYNLSGKDHSVPYTKSIALDTYSGTDSSFSFVDDLKYKYFPSNRLQIFYFMVIGSSQKADGSGGSSGIAISPGRDFLITLANWRLRFGTNTSLGLTYENIENHVVNYQAATIMHEFGHNLGLKHGGDILLNYKPNYYSIMNYLYQLYGLSRIGTAEGDRYYYNMDYYTNLAYYQGTTASYDSTWSDLIVKKYSNLYELDLIDSSYSSTFRMDYSHGTGGDLNEASLVESAGLKQSGSTAVDWNGSGSYETVQKNINPSYQYYNTSNNLVSDTSDTTVMSDYNDWSNLSFYYNTHSAGISRTIENTSKNIERENNAPRSIISIDLVR